MAMNGISIKIGDERRKSPNSGFTIMEMIVVIFIISFGLLGVISLVTQNVQVGYINKNMIIASQLCQEELELIRNIRDNNWMGDDDWKTGSTTNPNTDWIKDGVYSVDYTGTITNTTGIDDPAAKLYIGANNLYRHLAVPGTATSTAFSRTAEIRSETAASTTVECVVQWKTGTNTHRFTAQTVLYNWRPVP
jgi:prepilin-type N-terminal cleavage/methylation domain-containing protein